MAMVTGHNLFFAIQPPAGVTAEIERVRDGRDIGARRLPRKNLHISLVGLGRYADVSDGLVRRVLAAAGKIQIEPCRLIFDELVFADGRSLLAASEPVRGVIDLRRRVAGALASAGFPIAPSSRFRPHVTLAYGTKARPSVPVDPVSWRASEIVLIDSAIGSGRHTALARLALA